MSETDVLAWENQVLFVIDGTGQVPEKIPDVFELVIAVDQDGDGWLISWPKWFQENGWLEDGQMVDDMALYDVPTQPGVYTCMTEWKSGGYEDDRPDWVVTSFRMWTPPPEAVKEVFDEEAIAAGEAMVARWRSNEA